MDEDYYQVVDQIWSSTNGGSIEHKLKRCGDGLSALRSRKHKQKSKDIQVLTVRLKELQDRETLVVLGEIDREQRELNHLLDQENL